MALTQISTAGVKDDAVTAGKIPANAVGSSELADNAVDTAAIANDAVTDAKIADNAVRTEHIQVNNVTTAKINDNAVTTAKIADQAVTLAKLPHGDGSSDGKFLRANNGADPTFETVNTDLVADTSPQLGGALDTNGSNINFGDSTSNGTTVNRLTFGTATNGDLAIWHDGSNSYIVDQGTGELKIRGAEIVRIQDSDSGENMGVFNKNGSVELYHNNSKKFETKSDGFESRVVAGQNVNIGIIGNNFGDNSDAWRIRNQYAQDVLLFQTYQQGNWDLGSRLALQGTAYYGGLNIDSHANGQCLLETMYGGSYFTFRTQDGSGNVYDKLYIGSSDIVMRANDASGGYNYSNQTGIRFTPFGSNNGLWQQITFDHGTGGNTPGPYLYNLNSSHNGVRFYVKVDGGVVNHSGNNSNLCDERMKTNIVDAPSYYNSIKNIGIKKFNYTTEPEGTPLKVGVIAQQVETIESDLVDDEFAVDGSPNEGSSTKMKAVHEEQLFMMSIKALQEAMVKIETLEAKVAALEAA